ncbi:BMP family ABC transporter substrate-binding protein [Saxibacter everestensis]|uniref:BMP family ABC transporter substrate-binding protein n=1 Tax=Saxibacter everestensis TaxID=2909229 RepID=A0ABY8QPG3_9MICO|nr:BMP family ABC transporter substrate-binding protein [Brevibacteriaceae bacterium ZFBP1038]
MKTRLRYAAVVAASALLLTACGEAPTESGGGEASGSSEFLGCIVSDSGGFDDKSFNEAGFRGLNKAKEDGVISDTKTAESTSDADFAPNINQMVSQDCGLTITVGFLLATATADAAKANPESKFAIIDTALEEEAENVKSIQFDTAQAAYLAGYLAASQTKTGKVGTFGGIKLPSVTIFMDGFADGVAHFNEEKGKDVKVLGWDKAKQDGTFTGDFEDVKKGQSVSENLISQGADVLLPVAGPVGEGAAAAALDAKDVALIWVDSDGYETLAEKYKPLVMSTVVKKIDVAVEDVLKATAEGNFSNEPYVGTLENDGVALAPYHDWDSKIDDATKKEITDLQAAIIDGSVKVESQSSPK